MININSVFIEDIINNNKYNIIDVRSSYDYYLGSIPNSIHLDKYDLLNKPSDYLDRNKLYCIYCEFGNTSGFVVERLNSLGYNTVNLVGGYANYLLWKKNYNIIK